MAQTFWDRNFGKDIEIKTTRLYFPWHGDKKRNILLISSFQIWLEVSASFIAYDIYLKVMSWSMDCTLLISLVGTYFRIITFNEKFSTWEWLTLSNEVALKVNVE